MSDEHDLFTRLGGTRAIAERLGEAPSTVQSWKAAGRIPAHKQATFIEKHAEAGIEVSAEDVIWPFGRTASPGKTDDLAADSSADDIPPPFPGRGNAGGALAPESEAA